MVRSLLQAIQSNTLQFTDNHIFRILQINPYDEFKPFPFTESVPGSPVGIGTG